MSINLDHAMLELKRLFLSLSQMVDSSLTLATDSFFNFEKENISIILKKDKEIDALEIEVEEECLKILAMHQPVAKELRFIVAILKINNDLERIGDLSVSILCKLEDVDKLQSPLDPLLKDMIDKVLVMFRNSLKSFLDNDTSLAYQVCKLDDEVDELKDRMRQNILSEISRGAENIEGLMNLWLNARHLERIADLATNIAEDAIYLNEGKIIRHNIFADS